MSQTILTTLLNVYDRVMVLKLFVDLNDNEFFLEYETLDEYFKWCNNEKKRVEKNKFCTKCDYFGHCLSEHLRDVKSLDNSCNGFKHLIDWYKREF